VPPPPDPLDPLDDWLPLDPLDPLDDWLPLDPLDDWFPLDPLAPPAEPVLRLAVVPALLPPQATATGKLPTMTTTRSLVIIENLLAGC
jgi:hypothetical protein